MRPERDPLPRVKEAWVWLGGMLTLGLLGAATTVAAVLLWENIDVRQLTPSLLQAAGPLPVAEGPELPAIGGAGFTAVLFDSPRNRTYFADSVYYGAELDGWRDVIREIGGQVREASDFQDLREAGVDDVLVVPEAPCISPAELAAIRAHLAEGGSLVTNWAIGVRDAACQWRGWATLLELTGSEEVGELPSGDGLFLTVPAGVPFATGLDPGTRIALRTDPTLALRMEGPRVYWSDWSLNPVRDERGVASNGAAIATLSAEGGRRVWFGMRLGQAATPADSIRLRRLIQNGLLWAAGTTTAAVAPWPGAARAALVFALDVEAQPRTAMTVAALFADQQLPITFFAATELVSEDTDLGRALSAVGEIGTQTVEHTRLAGLTAQEQALRLLRSRGDAERWSGVSPSGVHPPEDAFDSLTIRGWEQAGGSYLLALNDARSASPEVYGTGEETLVVLPRLIKDDYNVIVQDRAVRADRIGEVYVEGMRKLRALGGLAVVAGHTQIMHNAARMAAFRTAADAARAEGDWWIARADRVARWWRVRASMELERVPPAPVPELYTNLGRSGLSDILIRAQAEGTDEDVWVDVVLPRAADLLIPLVDGRSVDFAITEWGMRVPVGAIGAYETHRIALVIIEDGSAPRAAPKYMSPKRRRGRATVQR